MLRKQRQQFHVMRKKQHLQYHIILTILIMIFIFVQSSLPPDLSSRESNVISLIIARMLKTDPEKVSFVVRKCAHFAEFLLLGISLLWTVKDIMIISRTGQGYRLEMKHERILCPASLIAWGIGIIYAVTDELHQSFVPGRSCEFRDMMIDSLGAGAGIILWMLVSWVFYE